jgi:hypothetical protein
VELPAQLPENQRLHQSENMNTQGLLREDFDWCLVSPALPKETS